MAQVTEEQLEKILTAFGWDPTAERGPDRIIHARDGALHWSDAPGQEVALGSVASLSPDQRAALFDAIGDDDTLGFFVVGGDRER